jgi:hypothetical protein
MSVPIPIDEFRSFCEVMAFGIVYGKQIVSATKQNGKSRIATALSPGLMNPHGPAVMASQSSRTPL